MNCFELYFMTAGMWSLTKNLKKRMKHLLYLIMFWGGNINIQSKADPCESMVHLNQHDSNQNQLTAQHFRRQTKS